jgi:hypothetical protein
MNFPGHPAVSTPLPVETPPVEIPKEEPETSAPVAEDLKTDELTEKLKKLKLLFDNSLISQEEYNQKKMELLSNF